MSALNITSGASGGGQSISAAKSVTADKILTYNKDLAAAKTGTLSTRTDANTGVLTLQASHGVATGDLIHLFWFVAGVYGSRRNITAGTVSGNNVPIDLGEGDDLPAQASAITVMEPNVEDFEIPANMKAIAFQSVGHGSFVLTDEDDVTIFGTTVEPGMAYTWHRGNGVAAPTASPIIKAQFAHGDSTGTRNQKLIVAVD